MWSVPALYVYVPAYHFSPLYCRSLIRLAMTLATARIKSAVSAIGPIVRTMSWIVSLVREASSSAKAARHCHHKESRCMSTPVV